MADTNVLVPLVVKVQSKAEDAGPGVRSATSVEPIAVPSERNSSRPVTPLKAPKEARPPAPRAWA